MCVNRSKKRGFKIITFNSPVERLAHSVENPGSTLIAHVSWPGLLASRSHGVPVWSQACLCTTHPSNRRCLRLHDPSDRVTVLCRLGAMSLLPLFPQLMTKNMLSYNKTGLFTSRIESKHLASRVVSNVSFLFSWLSGCLIMGVEWVKHLDSNNIIPLGESNCWTVSLWTTNTPLFLVGGNRSPSHVYCGLQWKVSMWEQKIHPILL